MVHSMKRTLSGREANDLQKMQKRSQLYTRGGGTWERFCCMDLLTQYSNTDTPLSGWVPDGVDHYWTPLARGVKAGVETLCGEE